MSAKERLIRAVENGDLEKVRQLLTGGANVNSADDDGETPLHWASWNGTMEIAELLIAHGATVNAVDNNGYTPLHEASYWGQTRIAQLLMKQGANVTAAGADGLATLHCASSKGNTEIAGLLIKYGADVNVADFDGRTPLHDASANGHLETAELLMKHGALVNATAYDGHTPLHWASEKGHTEVVELLIKHGADVNAEDNSGSTPLHFSSIHGHLNVGKLLQQNGAYVDATADNWNTPLHDASHRGQVGAARLLLDWGADVFAKNKNGMTALMVASEREHAAVVSLLEAAEKKAIYEKRWWKRLVPRKNSNGPASSSASNISTRSSPTATAKNKSIPPSMWSISYEQLMGVHKEAAEKFQNSYPAMTMRDVNEHIIRPVCEESGKSYALHLNPNGLQLDAFVTHAWDEPFSAFIESIQKVFRTSVKKPNMWICAFALVQGDEQTITHQIGQKNVPLTKSPFVKALQDASMFVVVRNSATDLYSRIWCVCELIYAKKFRLYPDKTYVTGPDDFSDLRTSCLDAKSSNPMDKARILKVLLNEHDFTEIDRIVNLFREHESA